MARYSLINCSTHEMLKNILNYKKENLFNVHVVLVGNEFVVREKIRVCVNLLIVDALKIMII